MNSEAMVTKLEELNNDLSNTTVSWRVCARLMLAVRLSQVHKFPEEYVKKTLLAHGFFTHAQIAEGM